MSADSPPTPATGASSLSGRSGSRALSQERADRRPLADLLGQHRDGALAAIDRAGHAERRDGGSRRSRWRTLTFSKDGDPRYFWTESVYRHGRGDRADLVRHRRAAADPYPTECRAGPAVRRVHGADPGTRCAPDAERRRRRSAGLGARTRGPALQHLRAGVLRKLDRGTLDRAQLRLCLDERCRSFAPCTDVTDRKRAWEPLNASSRVSPVAATTPQVEPDRRAANPSRAQAGSRAE